LQPGLYAVAHTFDVAEGFEDPIDSAPNVLIGRYKPHFHSDEHQHPTLFLVEVNAITSPLLGTEDIPPFGVKEVPWRDQRYLFLIRRKGEWPEARDSIIKSVHRDVLDNVEDDTWFEVEYEKEGTVESVLQGGRELFFVKTPDEHAEEVAEKKAKKREAKRKKEDEAAKRREAKRRKENGGVNH
jgi:hypothetical protein